MNDYILHDRENSEETESFLKENGEKFSRQCVQILQLLYRGMRLTAKQANDILDIADSGRRLREIKDWKKECKKDWKRDFKGKRIGVEYWLEIPPIPTKSSLQIAYKQKELFEGLGG